MTGWSNRCCPGGGRFRTITITDPKLVPTHRQGQVKLSVISQPHTQNLQQYITIIV